VRALLDGQGVRGCVAHVVTFDVLMKVAGTDVLAGRLVTIISMVPRC
jgi:hypothetical protein